MIEGDWPEAPYSIRTVEVVREGAHFENPRTGVMIEIVAWPSVAGSGKVEIRRLLPPGMGFRLPHVHLTVDETFEVELGVADFRIGHRSGRLSEGQQFRVPRYEVHTNPVNRSTSDLVVRQTFEAARTDGIRRYVETLARFIHERREVHGDLPPLVAAAVFAGKDQQTFAPWLPLGLQRKVLFPLAKAIDERSDERRDRAPRDARVGSWPDW